MEQTPQRETRERIRSIDLFRGMAVLILVWSHTLTFFAWEYVHVEGLPLLVILDWASALGAPIFYLTIGMALTFSVENRRKKKYSEKRIFGHLFKRFLFLMAIGYFINFTALPWELSIFYNSLYDIYIELWLRTLDWMIFHSIALFLICCYFISRLSWKKILMVLVGLLIGTFLISHLLPLFLSMTQGVPYEPYNMFMNLWLRIDRVDYVPLILQGNVLFIVGGFLAEILFLGGFPLFPWLAYCVLGLLLGKMMREYHHGRDYGKLKKILIPSIIILIVGGLVVAFITWIWKPLFLDPVFYLMTMSGTSMLFLYAFVYHDDVRKYDWVLFDWVRPLGHLPLTLLLIHNNIFLNLFNFIDRILGIPIRNTFVFPLFLLPTIGVLVIFLLMAKFWEKRDYNYGLEWVQSKL